MARVLVIATSHKTKGGISAILNMLSEQELWTKYNCTWIASTIDTNLLVKVFTMILGLIRYIVLLPKSDIVYLHVSSPLSSKRKYIYFRLAELLHKKTIIHLHYGNQINKCWNRYYEYMFTHSDVNFVLSDITKSDILRLMNGKADITVLHNPCIAVENDFSLRTKQILFAGTVVRDKGIYDLLTAFKSVSERHHDWTLFVAGAGETDKCKEMAHELGISDKVVFAGWISGKEKDMAFRKSSIFCLPSYAEGFPMAILDAWAYGLPVVTTPVGGRPNLAENNENSILVNLGDHENLCKEICGLIENENKWKYISRNAYNISHGELSVNYYSHILDDTFSSIL